MLHIAYIALGSNLQDPISQVRTAIGEIAQLPKVSLLAQSSLYSSQPLGPQDQDDFINAVVKISTKLTPEDLLTALQNLEHQHQRKRLQHWGPRTLDCDILLYDDLTLATDRLTIPHPEMQRRAFVMIPLQEIMAGTAPQKMIVNLTQTLCKDT